MTRLFGIKGRIVFQSPVCELIDTQRELAESANISTVMIHKLLSGKSNTTAKFLDLAKVLQCDPDWLLSGEVTDLNKAADELIPAHANVTTRMVPVISYEQVANWPESRNANGIKARTRAATR